MAKRFFRPCLLLALLAGCAGNTGRPAPVATPATVVSLGRPAVVVAIRTVDIGPGDGSLAGVDAVLAAISQPAASGHVTAQEVVVTQPGSGAASIGGAYAGLAAGQDVMISDDGGGKVLRGE